MGLSNRCLRKLTTNLIHYVLGTININPTFALNSSEIILPFCKKTEEIKFRKYTIK